MPQDIGAIHTEMRSKMCTETLHLMTVAAGS